VDHIPLVFVVSFSCLDDITHDRVAAATNGSAS
jgi:hypothetical protein